MSRILVLHIIGFLLLLGVGGIVFLPDTPQNTDQYPVLLIARHIMISPILPLFEPENEEGRTFEEEMEKLQQDHRARMQLLQTQKRKLQSRLREIAESRESRS